ncbi:MAG: PIG-L deacetylase family protein [Phototrophicaceae bacterium]
MTEQSEFYVPQSALVIMAHCDDIEFGAAGIVARWTDAGCRVTYCLATDSAAGSNDPATDLKQLVIMRQQEQMAAARLVGVDDVRFLNYADGTLQPTIELRRDLTRLIRQVRPQAVITMDPTLVITATNDYVNHPDHRAVGEAAMYAVFPSAGSRPIFPELLAEGLEPHVVEKLYFTLTNEPTDIVDVTPVYERKRAALGSHASQLNEEVVEMVAGWDAERGKAHGLDYAEAFRVVNFR